MFEPPNKGDLDRNLSAVSHAAHHKALAERVQITSEAAKHGILQSTRLIVTVASAADKIHKDAISEAMTVIREFADAMAESPKQISAWTRPHLENMANTLLAVIPPASFPADQQRVRRQYAAVFQQRLDGALRDFEIGFIGGKRIAGHNHVAPAEPKEMLALRPGAWGINFDVKEAWRRGVRW